MASWKLCVVELATIFCITGMAVYSLHMLQTGAEQIVSAAVGGLLGFLTRGAFDTIKELPVWKGRDSLTDSERGSGYKE